MTDEPPPRQVVLGGFQLDMPKKPWAGQNLAPFEKQETTIQLKDGSKSCWIKVDFSQEDCKDGGYEWKGGSYLPSYPLPKVPASERQ